jgi:uncharacterized protein
MNQPLICDIYKSLKDEELYLFVSREEGFTRVPETLQPRFNLDKTVTSFVLTPDKKLARADAAKVLTALEEQGFYLQMPPPRVPSGDWEMQGMAERNEKLPR